MGMSNREMREIIPVTFLFCPGHKPERFEKAVNSGSPGVVLDLEDAVPDREKLGARQAVIAWLIQTKSMQMQTRLALRINSLDTGAGLEDMYTLIHTDNLPENLIIMLPKVNTALELSWLAGHCHRLYPRWTFIALIETSHGILHASEICRSHPQLVAIGFGAADLSAELGISNQWQSLLFARSQLVMAANPIGIPLLDVPHLDIHADIDLGAQCLQALELGFHGKFAIHPRQVPIIVESFSPSVSDIEKAEKIITAFQASGGAACAVDGKMVDVPVYYSALRVLGRRKALP